MKRRADNIDYTLIQAPRSTIRLSVSESEDVRVYAPKIMRLRDIDAFVLDHRADVAAMERKIRARREAFEAGNPLQDGTVLLVLGQPVTLRVSQGSRRTAKYTGSELILTAPETDRDTLRALIRKALSEEALRQIRRLIAIYAPVLGVTPGRIAIREQKSRWGSCSDRDNLNFNWKLMLAPPEALEYVVIHELCHLLEFNHSARFWRLVESQMPNYDQPQKWLKTNSALLNL